MSKSGNVYSSMTAVGATMRRERGFFSVQFGRNRHIRVMIGGVKILINDLYHFEAMLHSVLSNIYVYI